MRKALTLLVAFAFMGSLATAQPVPPGGGSYILLDDFNGPASPTFWEGSCADDACDREDIEYVRGGAVPGLNGDGEWETWPACCEPGGGSGAETRKDGNGNITMQMLAPPWQSYIDARRNGAPTELGTSYVVICSLTMPANGSGGMFFGFADPGGAFSRGIKCQGNGVDGHDIYWTPDSNHDWGDPSGDMFTGVTAPGGEQFTVMFYISFAGDVKVWYYAGGVHLADP